MEKKHGGKYSRSELSINKVWREDISKFERFVYYVVVTSE
jgi:hypothetical protein